MPPPVIRPYRPDEDAAFVFRLWQASFDPVWPTTPELLQCVLTERPHRDGDHFVALHQGRIIGFVATQVDRSDDSPGRKGGITLLMVDPDARRRGTGRALHETALHHLRRSGVRRAQLAGGGPSRFWPGVPGDLPEALAFFRAQGWQYSETSYDLVQDMRNYRTPEGVFARAAEAGCAIQGVRPEAAGELMAFEQREFPGWAATFSQLISENCYEDILVARDAGGAIVGSLFIFWRESQPDSSSVVWRRLLGDEMGGVACVGVAPTMRDRGIGTALVARASEVLRERGVGHCHVGWTWLLDFYGRLGYTVWREYQMSWREIG